MQKGCGPVSVVRGMLIAYATAEWKTAADTGDFARILAEEILKPGIEAVSAFRHVQLRVKRTLGQEPWMSYSVLPQIYLAVRFSDPEPARIALLIGNQAYADAVGPLTNPHNDIERLSAGLKDIGFKVLPLVKDAGRREILNATYDFATQLKDAGPDVVGFFYYSGHGIADSKDGVNYLIPIGLRHISKRTLQVDGVRLSEITNHLDREAPNAANIVVFDACRNELRGTRGAKGFAPIEDKEGMLIAFASAQGMTASDGVPGEGGPYARALAKQIRLKGQHHLDLFFNVRASVMADPVGERQFPWVSDGLRRKIYLAGP